MIEEYNTPKIQEITMETDKLKSNTTYYIYLWANTSYDNREFIIWQAQNDYEGEELILSYYQ
jgi:hypothetical protein